ncbi:MAG: hypothetical protein AB8H79_04380 [Myxococcota bacterium]
MMWGLLLAGLAWAQSAPPAPPAPADPIDWSEDLQPQRFRLGRRTSVAGLFLGWAGVGLAAGGTALALSGRNTAPLADRDLLLWTVTGGAALGGVGLGIQVAGSHQQRRALGRLPRQPVLRGLGIAAAATGVAGGAVMVWRLHQDGPDGPWLLIAGPAAGIGAVGALGLHTVALLRADATVEEHRFRARVGLMPNGVRLSGTF